MPVCSGANAMGDVSLIGFGWSGQVRRPVLGLVSMFAVLPACRYGRTVTSLSAAAGPMIEPATLPNHNLLCPGRHWTTRHHKM
jgi:hypothetical protein